MTHLILRSALTHVLKEFAVSRGLNPEGVNLSLTKNIKAGNSSVVGLAENIKLIGGANPQAYESAVNSFYLSRILWISDYLGVNPLSSTASWFNSPPRPLKCDFEGTPMRKFDPNIVIQETEMLRGQIDPNAHYCIIMHGGSQSVKRFGLDQVRAIELALRTLYPKSKFAILTAQSVDRNGGVPISENDADLVVDAVADINKTAALFLAPKNLTFVGTDTFLSWFAAGMIANRIDRGGVLRPKDMYVLNTVATSSFWGIAGANHIESDAIEAIRSRDERLSTAADNMITPQEYLQYYNATSNDYHNVHPYDLAKFLRAFVAKNS